ncbi:hypothetical protein G7085_19630 [Tessaracoccus sp. HDW20]|uniref:hypothetical protein n=1 Tax=Tessaracoccus coleopterorum TaxID=2714950 RepID=UPI0018D47381|nr:hypothetical protein [Tessaracoccus coleopterorum]NHB86004.1 hypothetical protein [Tessaracoccus coleopterorum]
MVRRGTRGRARCRRHGLGHPTGVDRLVDEALRVLRQIQVAPWPGLVLGTACGLAGWRRDDVAPQLRALERAAFLVEEAAERG